MSANSFIRPLSRNNGIISISLACLAALGIYGFTLALPLPSTIGLFVRYNLAILSLISLPILFVSLHLKGAWGVFTSLTVTLLLFGLPLSGLWRSGASEPFIIGGLLPFSDAASYYSDALRVTEGLRFSAFSARRPLFPALLTVLLAITGQNLVLSLTILVALIAVACYLATRLIKHWWGALPASLFLLILFLFYRRISGAVMTENLGLPLGLAGFVVLLGSSYQKKVWLSAIGLLLLTLALNARAGTFFILPALILWSGFAFRGRSRFSLQAVLLNSLAVALGFGLNTLVFQLVADKGGMVFSNFSYTLYGVVAGGKGWMQILIDHPELAQLDDVARSARTYQLAFEAFKAHPFNFLIGAARNWFDYLMPRGAGAFGFVRGVDAQGWVSYTFRILLSLLAGWGLLTAVRARRQAPHGLLLWAAAGIFLSVPFVPPNDSNQMRVYAATIPFLIVLCAIGLFELIAFFVRGRNTEVREVMSTGISAMVVYGVSLTLLTIGGVLLVKAFTRPQNYTAPTCPEGQTAMVSRFSAGSRVEVGSDSTISPFYYLQVSVQGFTEHWEGYPQMHSDLVQAVGEGAVLVRSLDLLSLDYPLLLVNPQEMPEKNGLVRLCVSTPRSEELTSRGWLKVNSIESE